MNFRPMRRKDRQTSTESALSILEKGEYGVLSSVDSAGQPYGVPVSYAFDGVGRIYFHSAQEGHKLDNLRANPRVCFTVVGMTQVMAWKFSTGFESVIAFGTATEVEGDEKRLGLHLLAAKYNPGEEAAGEAYIDKLFDVTQVVCIRVEHLTGKERAYQPPTET
ncbi:MAG: MFS transporter [Chloroflexi bacterium HGW-Chloroflexi-10]|nr:MAG: MFS transporter [Chloroflexi bacterium HGW-Chloroflexi-10]